MGWDTEGETRRERHKREGREGSREHRPTANDAIRDCLSTLEVILISFSLLKSVYLFGCSRSSWGPTESSLCQAGSVVMGDAQTL